MTNTNNKDINSISFLQNLTQADKDIINNIINQSFIIDEEYNTIYLRTKDHMLKIVLEDNIIGTSYTNEKETDHTTSYRNKDGVLVTQTGLIGIHQTDIPYYVSSNDTNIMFNIFNAFNMTYSIYLDHKLIAIKTYNLDPIYFVKNTNSYKPKDVYLFFSKDLEKFNKEIYNFFNFLGVYTEDSWAEYFNAFNKFNEGSEGYFTGALSIMNDKIIDFQLLYFYFLYFLVPKFINYLKPELDILAKNGTKMHLVSETEQTWNTESDYNSDHSVLHVKFNLIDDKTNKTIYTDYLDYDFYSFIDDYLNYGDIVSTEITKLGQKIQDLALVFKRYLQPNITVAWTEVKKQINYLQENVSFNKLTNSNQIYVSSNLICQYGHLKPTTYSNLNFDSIVVVWKYDHNTLSYNLIDIYSLCINLLKNNFAWDKIVLPYNIINACDYKKIVYELNNYTSNAFALSFVIKPDQQTHVLEPWQNDVIADELMFDHEFCTNYDLISNNKIKYEFAIPYNEFNQKILDNIYHQFEAKIVLNDKVQKKLK